jgi:hypothetical protein
MNQFKNWGLTLFLVVFLRERRQRNFDRLFMECGIREAKVPTKGTVFVLSILLYVGCHESLLPNNAYEVYNCSPVLSLFVSRNSLEQWHMVHG